MSAIGFIGDGWGAVAALKSLQKRWLSIEVVTGDPTVSCLLRPSDLSRKNLAEILSETVVCSGFKRILKPEQLKQKQYLNVHYSLLPKYRGMHSTVWAVLNGEEYSGCTVHLMNEYVDDGPILAQQSFGIGVKSSTEIMEACNYWVENNLSKVVMSFISGELKPTQQNKLQATWVPKRNLDDCVIDFCSTHEYLERFFRALVPPYPRPMIIYCGSRYEVSRVRLIDRPYHCTNGRIVNIDQEGVWVKSSDGLVLIQELMLAGVVKNYWFMKIGARLG